MSFNTQRVKFGAPVIHSYMCYENPTRKMESWETPLAYQLSATKGFHAGKGIFLQTDFELDEKDIFRRKINDSTYEMLGMLTEVKAGTTGYPNIWYDTISVSVLTEKISDRTFGPGKSHLTIQQADSILTSWGTGFQESRR